MANLFEPIAQKLVEIGFIGFLLPWMITAAIFWGFLKRSKLFDNIWIDGVLALSASFFLWGYLVGGTAIELGAPLATFMAQTSIIILVLVFGIIGASMFYPDLQKTLGEKFKSRSALYIMIALFFGLFFSSGLYKIIIPPEIFSGPWGDVATLTLVLAILIAGLFIVIGIQGAKKKED
jgi:hypothetical protein